MSIDDNCPGLPFITSLLILFTLSTLSTWNWLNPYQTKLKNDELKTKGIWMCLIGTQDKNMEA